MGTPQLVKTDTQLFVEIDAKEAGQPIGMARVGQTFMLLQRLINHEAFQEDEHQGFFGRFERKQIAAMLQLNIREVANNSVIAFAESSGPGVLGNDPLPFSPGDEITKGFLEAFGALLLRHSLGVLTN